MSKKWTKKDVESAARDGLAVLGLALATSRWRVPGAEERYFEMLEEVRDSFPNEGISDDKRTHLMLRMLFAALHLWNDQPPKQRKAVFDKIHEIAGIRPAA